MSTNVGYIISSGTAIDAIGKTPEAARAEWLSICTDRTLPDADALLAERSDVDGVTHMRPATRRLIDQVENEGGAIAWTEIDGVCDIA